MIGMISWIPTLLDRAIVKSSHASSWLGLKILQYYFKAILSNPTTQKHIQFLRFPAWFSVLSSVWLQHHKSILSLHSVTHWLSTGRRGWLVRQKCRLIVWCSFLSVPQLLLDSPSPLLTNRGTMLWDKLCWLLALLALSSGALPPSNEPLSAPRIFLSFKGKALKILLWPSLFTSLFLYKHGDVNSHFCHHSLISWSCQITGMGKLLAPAEFGAWQEPCV